MFKQIFRIIFRNFKNASSSFAKMQPRISLGMPPGIPAGFFFAITSSISRGITPAIRIGIIKGKLHEAGNSPWSHPEIFSPIFFKRSFHISFTDLFPSMNFVKNTSCSSCVKNLFQNLSYYSFWNISWDSFNSSRNPTRSNPWVSSGTLGKNTTAWLQKSQIKLWEYNVIIFHFIVLHLLIKLAGIDLLSVLTPSPLSESW